MRHIDVHQLADEAKFNSFHLKVLAWCAVIIICDGYDLAVAGVALPLIMQEMGVNAQDAGFMMSSALFGMMVGAIFLGTIADRIGRRPTIAICVALFSVFTAASGLVDDPYAFSVMRFIAGLGIGGVMPNVVAQMTEFSPKRIRATMVTLMFSGYAIGGMLAAVLGKGMLEAYGWQSVFLAAGVPVLLVPFILKSLPETMPYLIRKNRVAELQRVLEKMQPAYRATQGDTFHLPVAGGTKGASVGRLFQNGRGFSTVMFWTIFFMCLFQVYALSSWLTKLMASAGYSLGSALTFTLVLNFGAVVGAIGGGWLADRFQIKRVMVVMYLLAALSIALLGYKVPTPVLYLLVGMAGATTIGTQIVTYAYTGQFYPIDARSTGIGFASGVGRMGAILAPIVIGTLIGMSLPLQTNFLVIAVPAVIAALAAALIRHDCSAGAATAQHSAPLAATAKARA
ncbi:MFS transporter [Massilia consociata]|uniref:MFS transporter n=1 Tax=Massilia consociata TaxID=760117 RepID=A0ABV6FH63_9BURK